MQNNGAKKKTVLLLRAPKEKEVDAFEQELKGADLEVLSIPVLSFEFVNAGELVTCLEQYTQYAGIVFTSPRCVAAVVTVYKELATELLEGVKKLKCYVVGKSTALSAIEAGFLPCGQESGNAEMLSKEIIKDLEKDSKPLLYPCGNLKKDTLPKLLDENGLKLTEVTVYKTAPNKDLEGLVRNYIHSEGVPEFVVFFSPSGVQSITSAVPSDILPLTKVKVIAIGPTTQKAIEQQGLAVYGVATKPEPQALLNIILKDR
ncbi:hypothetical protein ScPMuIL_006559 [Solemya velum]